MTISPAVELRFNPTDLRSADLRHAGVFLGSPAEALEAAFAVARARMVDQMREEIRGIAEPTHDQLLRIADLTWQGIFWQFRKISAPIIADAYVKAYRAANAGDVPMSLIYDLADKHAEKIGDYFHTSSRLALAEGFTTMVNRRIPARAAVGRVLDGYGLTQRQMRGFTSAKWDTPVATVVPQALKTRIREYVDKSFTTRIRKFSQQEEHNIDQQAQQFAWMWLQDKGRLSPKAMKMWITAKDERVCEICGPLHGRKVGVNQQFKTAQGDFWTPGLHPNCRCVVRLLEHRFTKMLHGDDLEEFNEEHPRDEEGRFSTKARMVAPRELPRVTTLERTSTEDKAWLAQMSALHRQEVAEAETETPGLSGTAVRTEGLTGGLVGGLTAGLTGTGRLVAVESGLKAEPITEAPLKAEGLTGTSTGLSAAALTTVGLTTQAITAATTDLAPVQVETQAEIVAATEPMVETEPLVHMPVVGEIVPIGEKIAFHDVDRLEPSDNLTFTDQDTWMGKQDALNRAFSDVDNLITDTVAQIVEEKGAGRSKDLSEAVVDITDDDGFTTTLTETELRSVVKAIAFGPDEGDQPQFWYSDQDREAIFDEGHDRLVHFERALGVEHEDFVQHIYLTDEAVEGNWSMQAPGSEHTESEWVNTGTFDVVSDSRHEHQPDPNDPDESGLIRWIYVRPTTESD